MLNRAHLLRELERVSDKLFQHFAHEHDIARGVWERIARDPSFLEQVKAAQVPWPLPQWEGDLDVVIPVERYKSPYTIGSIDGSQIYPDRHQGTSCFLINIGTVVLHYGSAASRVTFTSEPTVYIEDEDTDVCGATYDFVNAKRQEQELGGAGILADAWCGDHAQNVGPQSVLLDGTLIFWPLEAKDQQFKNLFFPRYCAHLQKLCDQGVPVASYISLPRSRDLVNLVRFALCEGEPDINDAHTAVNHVVDAAIVHSFLAPYTRTTVFKATQAICAEYPAALRPYFFYLHVGSEIARVELPEWVARNTDVVNMLAGVILDQTLKGSGYPVVIAEAHEQAVVKGPDRDFFYHIIRRFGVEQKKNLAVSQKSFKKRGLGI